MPRAKIELDDDQKFALMKIPNSSEEWLAVGEEYNNRWNSPYCIGAIDGKHITLQAPFNSRSEYFNYKGYFSIVLMAAVKADYSFLFANVGCRGRISDGEIFKNTDLATKLQNGTLSLPAATALLGQERNTPFVFVADDAFPL